MLIMSALAGLIASMFVASVAASIVAMRHEDVNSDGAQNGYNRPVF
jgi:hypothetical protein